MKKILLLAFVLIISACSKSENAEIENNSLVGRWYTVQYSQWEEPISECKKKGYIEFLDNGNYIEMGYYTDYNSECVAGGQIQGEWSIIDGVLALNDKNENFIYYIEKYEISGKKLTLYRPPLHPPYDEIFIEIYEKR